MLKNRLSQRLIQLLSVFYWIYFSIENIVIAQQIKIIILYQILNKYEKFIKQESSTIPASKTRDAATSEQIHNA